MKTLLRCSAIATALLSTVASAQNNKWNSAGLPQAPPGPRGRSCAGGSAGAQARPHGHLGCGRRWHRRPRHADRAAHAVGRCARQDASRPATALRMVPADQINDPLSTMGDPAGFPRQLLFELRPFQVVQTPNSVLMLYMFEKRWRVIWTDGRQLPTDPDPRWYGYSGRPLGGRLHVRRELDRHRRPHVARQRRQSAQQRSARSRSAITA